MIIPASLLWFLLPAVFLAAVLHILNKRSLHALASHFAIQAEQSRALHQSFVQEQLNQTRESLRNEFARISDQVYQLDQRSNEYWLSIRSELIETLLERLNTHTQSSQTVLIQGLESTTRQINERMENLSASVNHRLSHLSENVEQRLQNGFQNTHETFTRVMSRLATIDEAQKKIEGLTTNVISLNQLLGDKRARGAFGEVQLEHLVTNSLSPSTYAFQSALPNHPNTRPDCFLILPPPTGYVVIDAKFPLENYQRQYHPDTIEPERLAASKAFQQDIRRHIDSVASKYILPPVTMDSAMLFIPAESVFAEIHANYPDIVAYSQNKRVWLVSPTTLMAVLNTARCVIRDRETQEHILCIQNALSSLSVEFGRFDERMQKLVRHIKQVSDDVGDIHITSHKISRQFRHIERADMGAIKASSTPLTELDEGEQEE